MLTVKYLNSNNSSGGVVAGPTYTYPFSEVKASRAARRSPTIGYLG